MENGFDSKRDSLDLQIPLISHVLTHEFSSIQALIDSFSAFEVDLVDQFDDQARLKLRGSETMYDIGVCPFVDHSPEYFPEIEAEYCLVFGVLNITYSRKNKTVLNEIQVVSQRVFGKIFFLLEFQFKANLILEHEQHAVYQLGRDFISIEYVIGEYSSAHQIYLSVYKSQMNNRRD